MANNIWKTIEGFENYEVSNSGEVRNKNSKQLLVGSLKENGYAQVCLYNNGKKYCKLRHRLVAEAFIPNQHNLPQVNHKDENKTNNRVSNLEWCTEEYNINYGTRNEKVSKSMTGENNPNFGKKFSQEYIEKFIKHRRKKLYQYTIEGELVEEYISLNEAARINGYDSGNLSRSCRSGRISYGYIWSYDRA